MSIFEPLYKYVNMPVRARHKTAIYDADSWDGHFLQEAYLASKRSKDPSSQVGAVITKGKDFISRGYNGFARRVWDKKEYLEDREAKYARTIHAEINAILFAKRDLEGMTLYLTHPPCAFCAAVICQVGISKVVYLKPSMIFLSRWDLSVTFSQFMEAGVETIEVEGFKYDVGTAP